MIGSTLARVSRPVVARQQRRGIVDWMTNYPDKVSIIYFIRCRCGAKKRTAADGRCLPSADTIEYN
eukprot:scaffold28952_cov198-Skeletonema_marinoi.AAC.6